MSRRKGSPTRYVDFDLHGLVRVRLVDPSDRDIAVIQRQVGPIRTETAGDADIVVRFVDELDGMESLRLLGVHDVGFSADHFYILRGKQKSRVKVRFPVDRIGSECMEIVCERGLPAVPHLIAVINLTALSRDALPMHASAFIHQGMGVMVTGWAKGGKTETLMAFAAAGAEYIGDEWIYLTPEGRMLGIPEPMRVWDWQLAEMPLFRARARPVDRLRLKALGGISWGMEHLANHGSGLGRLARRLGILVEGQRFVHLEPALLFGGGQGAREAPLEKILFVASHTNPANVVRPLSGEKVAERMVYSLLEERRDLISLYNQFRFAFPDRSNDLLDGIEDLQRALMANVLRDVEAYEVLHPYPVSISSLYDSVAPVLTKARAP